MTEQTAHDTGVWSSRAKWAFGVFAIVGAFFLIAEHRAHVLPYVPWLLLAACPLMHLFMHGGHGGHGGHLGRGGGDRSGAGSAGAPEAKAKVSWGGAGEAKGNNHQHYEAEP